MVKKLGNKTLFLKELVLSNSLGVDRVAACWKQMQLHIKPCILHLFLSGLFIAHRKSSSPHNTFVWGYLWHVKAGAVSDILSRHGWACMENICYGGLGGGLSNEVHNTVAMLSMRSDTTMVPSENKLTA